MWQQQLTEEEEQYEDALKELHEEATERLPPEDAAAYREACVRCPDLVRKESNPLLFLRYHDFNAPEAAKRITSYWKTRKEVFGENRFCRSVLDLEGDGALSPGAIRVHETGWHFCVPPDNYDGIIVGVCDRDKFRTTVQKKINASVEDSIQQGFFMVQLFMQESGTVPRKLKYLIISKDVRVRILVSYNRFFSSFLRQSVPLKTVSCNVIIIGRIQHKTIYEGTILPFLWTCWAAVYTWVGVMSIDFVSLAPDDVLKEKAGRLAMDKLSLLKKDLPVALGGRYSFAKFKMWYNKKYQEEFNKKESKDPISYLRHSNNPEEKAGDEGMATSKVAAAASSSSSSKWTPQANNNSNHQKNPLDVLAFAAELMTSSP